MRETIIVKSANLSASAKKTSRSYNEGQRAGNTSDSFTNSFGMSNDFGRSNGYSALVSCCVARHSLLLRHKSSTAITLSLSKCLTGVTAAVGARALA
jgi:hypothetical protein